MSEQALVPRSFAGEDPLERLRRGEVRDFAKGAVLCDPTGSEEPRVFLIMEGCVAITAKGEDGLVTYLQLRVAPNDLVGYEALRGERPRMGAECITRVKAMVWTVSNIMGQVHNDPLLTRGLYNVQGKHKSEQDVRMAIASRMNLSQVLAAVLVIICDKLGVAQDGCYVMPPFTHDVLAKLVWTSREIITQHMNSFRRSFWIDYSRKKIVLKDRDALIGFSLGTARLPAGSILIRN